MTAYCAIISDWQNILKSDRWKTLVNTENELLQSLDTTKQIDPALLNKYQIEWKDLYEKEKIRKLTQPLKKHTGQSISQEDKNLLEIASTFTLAVRNIFKVNAGTTFEELKIAIEEGGAIATESKIQHQIDYCQRGSVPIFESKKFEIAKRSKSEGRSARPRPQTRALSPNPSVSVSTEPGIRRGRSRTPKSLNKPLGSVGTPYLSQNPAHISQTFFPEGKEGCLTNSKQLTDFLNLTKQLDWRASDYFDVLRFLNNMNVNQNNQPPFSFQLHNARFNQKSYLPNTSGLRGVRGKEILPSYLYQIANKGCVQGNLDQITNAFRDIENKTFFTQSESKIPFKEYKNWDTDKKILNEDPTREECLKNYENQVQTFLNLIQLARLNTGLDIQSVITILALENLAPKIQRDAYRIGLEFSTLSRPFSQKAKIAKWRGKSAGHPMEDKMSFLSYLLNRYCSKLQMINQLIFEKLLNEEQKKAFLKKI